MTKTEIGYDTVWLNLSKLFMETEIGKTDMESEWPYPH